MTGTFNETHFEFDAEIERLDEEIGEIDDRIDELQDAEEDVSDQLDVLAARKSQLGAQRKGVIWARDSAYESDDFGRWDDDVDGVTLAAVRAGVYGRLKDDIDGDRNAGSGSSANLLVAEGTVEAPYLDKSASEAQQTAAVASLHPFYVQWAEARINSLMDPEVGAGNATPSDGSPKGTSTDPTSKTE